MTKSSVLSRPLPNSSLPRNTFDRSFVMNYNWSAGFLLPVFAQFVPAGSHVQLNRAIFCRTSELNTAAFVQLDHFIDFFKVPLRLLMSRYNEFKLNINDLNSSALVPSGSGVNPSTPPASMPFFAQSDYGSAIAGTGGSPTYTDQMGSPIHYGAQRLLDLLGYNDTNIISSSAYSMNYNAFRLLAYQKVYFDHYRNSAYESNDPEAYNADYDVLNNGSKLSVSSLRKALTIRYHNYRKDFFQNIYPGLNYVISQPGGTNWLVPTSVVDASSASQTRVFSVNSGGSSTYSQSAYVTQNPANFSNLQIINSQSIRAMFALDKLQRLSAYAPKHVKEQLEARFGVKASGAKNNESTFLGSFKNQISIGEVTSTANTDQSGAMGDRLGAIGGKGVGGSSYDKDIVFDTFDDDCLIMGIAYTLPRSMYNALRVDSFNFKFSREDIFNPEFMDLGLRPLTRQEFLQVISSSGSTANNYILGYVPRDQEYKIGIDENHGLFRSGSLDVFVTHTNESPRGLASGSSGVTLSFFKCFPTDLDDIFVTSFDPQYQITDQFFGQIAFKFVSRQNMSVHGQPRL